MKQLYELLTYPLTVIDDPILDFIFITILGSISFIIAWNFVGETGIRGKAGSILHWTIRIIVMFILSTITSILIKCALFLYNMPKEKWIIVGILFLVLIIMGIILKFTLFSKKEKCNRLIEKRKNMYLFIMKKIVNQYYENHNGAYLISNIINISNKEELFVYQQLENMLLEEKLLKIDKERRIIGFRGIAYLEKYIKENMSYIVGSLAFLISLITFIISVLKPSDLVMLMILIVMVGFIFYSLPKNKK